jgi:hypothetical protein
MSWHTDTGRREVLTASAFASMLRKHEGMKVSGFVEHFPGFEIVRVLRKLYSGTFLIKTLLRKQYSDTFRPEKAWPFGSAESLTIHPRMNSEDL